MPFSSYADYLQSPHWHRIRAGRIILAHGRCEQCHGTHRLEVHHLCYRPRWEDTRLDDLRCLCRRCHKKAHRTKPQKPQQKPPDPARATTLFQSLRAAIT